jgi:plasmid stabilization system protein ParE
VSKASQFSVIREAELEFDDAFEWYEFRSKGLGIRFAQSIDEAFQFIAANPEAAQTVDGRVRRFVVKTFPYSIYYHWDSNNGKVLVIAILHFSRNPKSWRGRADF